MSRKPRNLQPHYSYHITCRCNNREFKLVRRECREVILYAIDKTLQKYQFGDAGHLSLQAMNIKFDKILPLKPLDGIFSSGAFGTGQGGDIRMIAENSLNLLNDSYIQNMAWGSGVLAGMSGNIYLQADTLNIEGSVVSTSGQLVVQAKNLYLGKRFGILNARLRTFEFGKAVGNSGNITIEADNILLEDGADIASFTANNDGNGGDIDIQVHNKLTVRGASPVVGGSTQIMSGSIKAETSAGSAGNIHIRAREIELDAGGIIDASQIVAGDVPGRQAGNITLEVEDTLTLSGVNPYGQTIYGFASRIVANSRGIGNAGNIQIQAGSVSISEGALIEASIDSQNYGGGSNINIQADEYITISGDASQISLEAPGTFQEEFAKSSNLPTYNQSISGIYARSTSNATNSGDSGQIELSTPLLSLSNQAQISTASEGGGQSGQIILQVEKLLLSDNALIRSDSTLVNQLTFDSVSARDNSLISFGTVVKTQDSGNGKSNYQINAGNVLIDFLPTNKVADMTALENLAEQIDLKNGDIVVLENQGESARFIYYYTPDITLATVRGIWTRINEDSQVTLEQYNILSNITFSYGNPPYADGTKIHVKDMGNGKAADFIYIARARTDAVGVYGRALDVEYYKMANITALQELTATTNLKTGTQVDVAQTHDGNPASFVFDGEGWVGARQMIEVPDLEARRNLVLAQPGHIAHLPDNDTIYTGSEWTNLGQTYRVNNLTERDALNVQPGDLVKVADVGNGRHDAFVYADGQWIKQLRGGDAGQIVINADKIQLTDGSEISTGSISGGGGSVTLNVDKMVFLNNSQVSTSVQEGVGSGGDLTITNPQFIINNGNIIAQANEGYGGNIKLVSDQFIASPNSTVSASSKLGIDGKVDIDSPDVDVSGALLGIPAEFFDASTKLKSPCHAQKNKSKFMIKHLKSSPPSPYDWKSNWLVLAQPKDKTTPHSKIKTLSPITSFDIAEQLALKVALLTGCQSIF
ncbi:hypothetical protein [Candidatus Parabeggiatoa sp. HSG14]|uniref:hypothetical protein n=1 Tax=Candidatus Parabeggiatoa sp. HSG14 TaxID=3055593 RepID=UPI0025A77E9B|nr:hypothetical protein [Thiotrichales bacterium HSG14]